MPDQGPHGQLLEHVLKATFKTKSLASSTEVMMGKASGRKWLLSWALVRQGCHERDGGEERIGGKRRLDGYRDQRLAVLLAHPQLCTPRGGGDSSGGSTQP